MTDSQPLDLDEVRRYAETVLAHETATSPERNLSRMVLALLAMVQPPAAPADEHTSTYHCYTCNEDYSAFTVQAAEDFHTRVHVHRFNHLGL